MSTDEGLSQQFNSLDAQREAAEAYIASQKHEGWELLPTAYNDGGFSGGNMDRPALKRLMADVEAGAIDTVIVYKVDRLSRSLLDFARIMSVFDQHGTSFVSVTQQFNTTSSLGRLTLNILLSFAQFEREIIGERTRDKMSAARRKGKWVGGMPVVGYDVDPRGGRLNVNQDEAERVRAMFDLYLQHGALMPVVRELDHRGWTTKEWTTKDGRERTGQPFTKARLFRLLTNVIYRGDVNHKGTIYPGEHEAIVDPAVFNAVDQRLRHNGVTGGKEVRNKYSALLRGLLHCERCGTPMLHTYTVKSGRRYRYYVCYNAQQRGWDACPTKSLNAQQIEDSVVERIRHIGRNPGIVLETIQQVREESERRSREVRADLALIEKTLAKLNRELAKVAAAPGQQNGLRLDRMADLQDQIRLQDGRAAELRSELEALQQNAISDDEVAAALADFDTVWKKLITTEQVRLINAIIERITYDGTTGKVAVSFRATGFKSICNEGSVNQK